MNYMTKVLPRRLKPWLWRKLSDYMHLEYRLASGMRIKIASYSDRCIYNDIFVVGEYDQAIESALTRSTTSGTFRVVDLGANAGFFTLRVLELINRRKIPFSVVDCLLVEASPRLEQTIRNHLHGLKHEGLRTQVVIGLVGKRTGEAQLELGASECMNQVVKHSSGESFKISYYDLDVPLGKVAFIDLLECDIEGSERDFLENYQHLLQKTGVAVFEFHEPQCPAKFGLPEVMRAGFTCNQVLYDQGNAQTVCFER
jgi:FkbM family methyltransferase